MTLGNIRLERTAEWELPNCHARHFTAGNYFELLVNFLYWYRQNQQYVIVALHISPVDEDGIVGLTVFYE